MNQHEENKFNMYDAVDAVLESNSAVIAEIPALGIVHTDLHELIGKIRAKDEELSNATAGKTSVKGKATEELINSVVPVASAVKAYAARNKMVELRAVANYSSNQLKRLSQVELPTIVSGIKKAAQGVLASLANFGITQAKLDLIDTRLLALKAATGNKDVSFTDRSAVREALYKLFDDVDDLLNEEADQLVEVLKETQLNFYNQYFAARVIKDLGGAHSKPDDEQPPTPPTPES